MGPMIRKFGEAREALQKFYFQPGAHTYTLDRMRQLMKFLGNPQNKLCVLHVAGTSGKGSTAYFAMALLQAAGFKVGLTVSPHVVEMNERLQIDGEPLAEAEFCGALGIFIDRVLAAGIKPSYFELMIAFAYDEFVKRGVDYAVVEVGLGGLIDGTNVIKRDDKVCIITDIGFDHTNVLGDTIAEIAMQKAGIIQPYNHAFMYRQSDEAMAQVRYRVREQFAVLHEIEQPKVMPPELGQLVLFQQRNFYLAQQAVEYTLQRDGRPVLSSNQVVEATNVYVPGRMEMFNLRGKTLVLDGAHNGQKMNTLLTSMRAKFPNTTPAVLVAFVGSRDKRWQHALDALAGYADNIIVTTFNHESDELPKSGMPAEDIADYLQIKGKLCIIEPDLARAFDKLQRQPEKLLLITGSLYPLEDIRRLILGQAA